FVSRLAPKRSHGWARSSLYQACPFNVFVHTGKRTALHRKIGQWSERKWRARSAPDNFRIGFLGVTLPSGAGFRPILGSLARRVGGCRLNFVPNTKPIQILAARQNARPLIHLIAGARPNFMKIAPLWHALHRQGEAFDVAIVHTGQHYDDEMSDVFLRQFG